MVDTGMRLIRSRTFVEWVRGLKDRQAAIRIARRVERLGRGAWGDWKNVGGGVLELRVDYGPGYRIYVANEGTDVVVLLCGGDKRTQASDILTARRMLSCRKGNSNEGH